MPNYFKADVILVRYPFSDLSSAKVRPAIVVNTPHISQDLIITPLTSQTRSLLDGEFLLTEWALAGLNVETAVKRGLFTIYTKLVVSTIGKLAEMDAKQLNKALMTWLGLSMNENFLGSG